MKRLFLYIVMLATTFSTVYFALIWEPDNAKVADKIGSVTEKSNEEDDKELVKLEKKEEEIKTEESTPKEEGKIKESKVEIIDDTSSKEVTASISLLKMNAEDIIEDISLIDKAKLVKIGYKLQTVDRKKIEDWILYSDLNLDGVRNAYKLLKSRLSTNDFNELEEILTPYVNFEVLGEAS